MIMKKYTTNRSKLLLSLLTTTVIVSTLPVENVFAAENEIPTLNVYVNENGSPKLEWATEMLKENILNQTSFELGEERPNLIYNNKNGQQSFITETAFSGINSIKIGQTTPNLGNDYSYPATSNSMSRIQFNERRYIADGTNLSLNLKVKTDSQIIIRPTGIGGKSDRQMTFSEFFKANEKFTLTKSVGLNDKEIYITNADLFKEKMGTRVLYVITNKSDNGNYAYSEILNVDTKTGKLTLKNGFNQKWEVGEEILIHQNTNPVNFPARTVANTNGEWVTVSLNTIVNGNGNYNTLLRGFEFWLRNVSYGNSYIDDMTFGYATEVELFRDGTPIYKGYLSDFQDTKMKDTLKPNPVNKINTTVSNDFKVNFVPVKPNDQSKKVSYTIQAIANNGSRSEMSKPKVVETATGVQKYKYSISKSSTTPTTLTSTTNGLDFDIPLSMLNLETDYIHIQALDLNNNASTIQTFKVSEIVDMEFIQSLYDNLKKVENNANYQDFLTFVDEVESLYGTNIPQDIKDRIQDLARYHGENTAFLELLEGDFSLTTKDITSFGKVKLTAEKQILKTNFADNFTVIDARGTQQGWKVNVSATPFMEDTFDGFIGTPTQLPIGTLAVNHVRDIQQVGLVHESKLPKPFTNDFIIIDSGEVTVLNADKAHGMGEFTFNFGDDALSMVIDSTTAKIDNKNYPEGVTPYTSTITWNLITGP